MRTAYFVEIYLQNAFEMSCMHGVMWMPKVSRTNRMLHYNACSEDHAQLKCVPPS